MKRNFFIVVLLLTISCATITRHNVTNERDNFLNRFQILNKEIMGELKYDNPDLDLKTMGIKDYTELFGRVDRTKENENVINFLLNHIPVCHQAQVDKFF